MRADLPSGTVTFLFTDVEGSTELLHELGAEAYGEALAEHRRLIREACATQSGVEVDTQGDAFFFAFASAPNALAAAASFTDGLESGPIRVRVGLHTGTPHLAQEGYVGSDVHRGARIAAAGHGQQVLVSAATAGLTGTEGLRDLGEHRFKDLAAPERVYQLGETDFPPLKSLYRTNLPVPATPFLGREHELAELIELLSNGSRLLTLTGPGGTGKTRLAIQAAAEVSDLFPDGVFWVPLAPLRDPPLVADAVAQALEIQEVPGAPLADTLAHGIAAKRALLLLDNCEHLLDSVAELGTMLVQRCPELRLTATSRERLGLRGERLFSVPPMAAADGEALFVERAQVVQADFVPDEHVQAICEAVDGLPLAIELAAARVRSLSPQAIRQRLGERLSLLTSRDREVDERQRTLEATIAWSYELLVPEEQRALGVLSIFAGGCTLEAAEVVACADLDLLESLLDKSLVRHRVDRAGQERYWMLETIREYAAERLSELEDAEAAAGRHAAWVLELLRQIAPRWAEPAPQDKLDRVRADDANVRIVVEQAIERGQADTARELVGLIGRAWLDAARFVEMRTWAHLALGLGGESPTHEGMTLLTLGYGSGWLDRESFARAAEVFSRATMPREAAYATMVLGVIEGDNGAVDRGLELLEAARVAFERLDDAYCLQLTQHNIDYVEGLRWPIDPAEARKLAGRASEAAARARGSGDRGDEIAALDNLSHALMDAGELDEAWSVALTAVRLMGDEQVGRFNLGALTAGLARCAALRSDGERALLLGAALRSLQLELGQRISVSRLAALEAAEAECRKTLDAEKAAQAIAEGEALTVESLLEYLGALADDIG